MKRIMIAATLVACMSSVASAQQRVGYVAINGVRTAKCERMLAAGDAAQYSMFEPLKDMIENIEIVKGLAAVKLYGPDAGQGAILITLKKGAIVPANICDRANPSAAPALDPIAQHLYPPELVMAHQDAIDMSAPQRTAIQVLAMTAQLKMTETQHTLSAATEKLATMLAAPVVDEAAVLQQIDQVLALEREVKRAQLTLLVRVKNQLTAAQQEKLDKLK
jgi:Spy/CpxP family protein refolding chaperone